LAALVRERNAVLADGATGTGAERRATRKVSLRSVDDTVDVSAIARAQGGGGHRRAAGFSTELSLGEIADFLRTALSQQLREDEKHRRRDAYRREPGRLATRGGIDRVVV
jgi:phosphoesterase RecJ-like protein